MLNLLKIIVLYAPISFVPSNEEYTLYLRSNFTNYTNLRERGTEILANNLCIVDVYNII